MNEYHPSGNMLRYMGKLSESDIWRIKFCFGVLHYRKSYDGRAFWFLPAADVILYLRTRMGPTDRHILKKMGFANPTEASRDEYAAAFQETEQG